MSMEPASEYLQLSSDKHWKEHVYLLERANVIERHRADPTLIRLVRFHI
jgi:hypothetical protein